MTFLEGETTIGRNGVDRPVDADRRLARSATGARCRSRSSQDSTIGTDVRVGPFVRMRPGTVLEDRSMAGAFVDLKNARSARARRCPHLSYVGDARSASGRNVGAGTVTANFDGYRNIAP